ncbi:alkylation response protein AidB-like acyl-CoA dehydrogenase [Parabacteroides sp. PFB2-12]|uniref:acyl-CoA dehydrogenase family protein n=1 Tax=unclassified Parabacteroides TaxID=2649774 RepID=UPI002473CE1B|nr:MULTISPECIES: acyl-CoA dehydrogenase family protein [unclassified Parabacteroides]MDH6344014.1 alkylation response protein AidB-like acyl-CoA dehydrogenase [Parabacteroides sp. PM6-13]MDH6391874.1 alkylation response protein AidB-like acyl-CoA dehydrogenase [Parabacteroides sp. PFB2-12]
MANYFQDTPGYKHHLHHPLMKRIVELKERNYTDKDKFDYAPFDFEDAMDSYEKVLEIVGEICDEIVAPNAEGVDHEGPTVSDGRVTYASGTQRNLDAVRKAGLMGMAMPRRYGGLNFPIVPYIMAADMVSRADAGFENLWGLQDCAETLYEFGNDDQRERYIPRICGGETMSMDLTEPDAGSDLQSVMLKATYSEKDQCWYLNGVKRFITNGDADVHLVLARSEDGTRDGRGLSMFIYDKRNGGVNVRRIENKMGIKGSPTCELVYKNAKAELCGERKLGLIKYVMALMNGARLGIMAQSVGLCEAAYREGYNYAIERKQFGKAIIEFPAVYEMVALMRAKADASRSMLYETARFVDVYKALEDIARERKLEPEERQELKKYSKLADAFTPMGKGMTSEYANQNAYDAIQIHGGSGFMKDYACERLYRDARITNIYEGTTQLQVVAAIRYVTTGLYLQQLREYEGLEYKPELEMMRQKLIDMTNKYEELVKIVTELKDQEVLDFHARRLVETAAHCVFGYLLLQDTQKDESFRRSAEVYITYGQAEVNKAYSYITNFDCGSLGYFKPSM